MPVSYSATVVISDTPKSIPEALDIVAIKHIAGNAPQMSELRIGPTPSGLVIWEQVSNEDAFEQVRIKSTTGVFASIKGQAMVFLYLR